LFGDGFLSLKALFDFTLWNRF